MRAGTQAHMCMHMCMHAHVDALQRDGCIWKGDGAWRTPMPLGEPELKVVGIATDARKQQVLVPNHLHQPLVALLVVVLAHAVDDAD